VRSDRRSPIAVSGNTECELSVKHLSKQLEIVGRTGTIECPPCGEIAFGLEVEYIKVKAELQKFLNQVES
jgi:hypothetical protein